jgi:hypothetical protein
VEAGRYNLLVDHPRFIPVPWMDARGSQNLDVTDGKDLTGLDVRMVPGVLITGRVTQRDDQPLAGARVIVLQWNYQLGHRVIGSVRSVNASADGTFTAGGLRPGTYYLAVQENETLMTFYPNVPDPTSAVPISLAAGGSATANIRMRGDPTFHARGSVTGTSSPVQLEIYPLGPLDARAFIRYIRPTATGEFDIDRLPAGRFAIRAFVPGSPVTARTEFTLTDRDVDDVEVRLTEGVEITGRVTIEEASATQPAGSNVPALRAGPIGLMPVEAGFGGAGGQMKEDGSFVIPNVALAAYGPLRPPLPPGTYLKAVNFGGEDITNRSEYTFTAGGTMQVLLSARAGEILGVVRDREGKPVEGVTVTVWRPGLPPAGSVYPWQAVQTQAGGSFRIQGLAPGEYRLAAWEQVNFQLTEVPEFRTQFDGTAKTVKVSEGSKESADAPLIVTRAIDEALARLR